MHDEQDLFRYNIYSIWKRNEKESMVKDLEKRLRMYLLVYGKCKLVQQQEKSHMYQTLFHIIQDDGKI